MADNGWLTWREAWQQALYGATGFYRGEQPRDHFRTSVHASPLFAQAVVALARRLDVDSITDLGAGSGELLCQIADVAPDLALAGVELRPRPLELPDRVRWTDALPASVSGLLIANEVLDNIACDIVELDASGEVRVVEVRPTTGEERLGDRATEATLAWLETWWPLLEAGERAEVGLARDDFWAAACGRVTGGACLAIDFGHLKLARPGLGTVASYAAGRQVPVALDGRSDVTASVAVDSAAVTVGAEHRLQKDMLADLGLNARRPPLDLASSAPAQYVRALARASQAAELVASPGLGDFWWLLSPRRHFWPDTPTERGQL